MLIDQEIPLGGRPRFHDLTKGLLRLLTDLLQVKFAIAYPLEGDAIANEPNAPLMQERPLAELAVVSEQPLLIAQQELTDTDSAIRFCVGLRLIDEHGHFWGTLAIADDRPRILTPADQIVLANFADHLTVILGMQSVIGKLDEERTRFSTMLQQREEYFRAVTDNISGCVLIIDADSRIAHASGSIERVLGHAPDERIGRSALEEAHPDDRDRLASWMRIVVEGGSLEGAEFRFQHKNGSWRTLELEGTNLLHHPQIHGVLVSAHDVTDRRRLKQELEQLNRLSSLGRLSAQVAHEFNNVLMGIQPAVDVLRRKVGHDEHMLNMTELIASSISRGKRITNDILRFGRPAQLALKPIDVAEFLCQATAEIRPLLGAPVKLVLQSPEVPLTVSADRAQLAQVLINMALNANDAMSNSGTLTIGARPGDQHSTSTVELPNSHEFVHINITDSGEGIPSEDLPYIFEPLFTTKRTGTGLGLSVVYQVITGHGGRIYVESKRGEGTTFHLFLPLAIAPQRDPESEIRRTSAVRTKPRVLIVEDETAVATGLRWILEAEGIVVHVVGLAADVIPAVDAFRPDVILLDLSLPDGDGRAVYEQIAPRHLPVIFSTGSASERELAETDRLNVPTLHKPYTADDLLRIIYEVLSERPEHD